MEIGTIQDLILNVGFPTALTVILIIALFAILRSYKKTLTEAKDDILKVNDKYHEDCTRISESLNKNTTTIELCVKLLETILHREIGNNEYN